MNPRLRPILLGLADRLLACREASERVVLFPHVDIDADGLATSLALLLALRKLDIQARLPMDEPVPEKLTFLPALDQIEAIDPDDALPLDVAVAIDCGEAVRMGRRGRHFAAAPVRLVLDHHVSSGEAEPGRLVDPGASASAELVFELILALEAKDGRRLRDPDIDFLLMSALISDTGGFIFANTTAETFRVAARLMERPLNLREITYRLFDRSSMARLRLKGIIFGEARFSTDGRIVTGIATQRMMQELGAQDGDLDGLINDLRNVAGVDVAMLVRELANGRCRVNIRSSECLDAAQFATAYGGGGHQRAAGFETVCQDPNQLAQTLMEHVQTWL